MEKSLIDYLKQIPNFRHSSGRRHPLWLVLLIIILGMMSGYWGYRGLGWVGKLKIDYTGLKM